MSPVIPFKPFLESEIAGSASNYLMAALFGCLVLAFIAPGGKTEIKNKLLICVIPFVLTAVLAIAGILETSAAVAMMPAAIPVCLTTAGILYKKGIVKIKKGIVKIVSKAQFEGEDSKKSDAKHR